MCWAATRCASATGSVSGRLQWPAWEHVVFVASIGYFLWGQFAGDAGDAAALGDVSLLALVVGCRALREVNIGGATQLTFGGVASMLSVASCLQEVVLASVGSGAGYMYAEAELKRYAGTPTEVAGLAVWSVRASDPDIIFKRSAAQG